MRCIYLPARAKHTAQTRAREPLVHAIAEHTNCWGHREDPISLLIIHREAVPRHCGLSMLRVDSCDRQPTVKVSKVRLIQRVIVNPKP